MYQCAGIYVQCMCVLYLLVQDLGSRCCLWSRRLTSSVQTKLFVTDSCSVNKCNYRGDDSVDTKTKSHTGIIYLALEMTTWATNKYLVKRKAWNICEPYLLALIVGKKNITHSQQSRGWAGPRGPLSTLHLWAVEALRRAQTTSRYNKYYTYCSCYYYCCMFL